jgi:hypothetical protein
VPATERKSDFASDRLPQLVALTMHTAITRKLRDLHSLELRIPRAQKLLRLVVFPPVNQGFGVASQHDPTELSPILLITIDNNGNRWILSDILQALERGA